MIETSTLIFLIPIIAIVSGAVVRVVNVRERARAGGFATPDMQPWMAEQARVQQLLVAKIDALDTRLAGIEKTLNEIPS